RALTTTTTGLTPLQEAVVHTAAAIGGGERSSMLALRDGDSLTVAATEGEVPPLSEWPGLNSVLSGQTGRLEHPDHRSLVAVPMFYQDDVVGTLATIPPKGALHAAGDSDVD